MTAPLTTRSIRLFAVAGGVLIGTLYFPQAITPVLTAGLHVTDAGATRVVTAVQLGYTAGIFAIVPLADRLAPRMTVLASLGLCGAGLSAAALAPSLAALTAAVAAAGTGAVAAQLLGVAASRLVEESRRGELGGTLLGGTVAGMLLARPLAGALGAALGWRAPFAVDAVAVLALVPALATRLPRCAPVPSADSAPSPRPVAIVLAAPARLVREPALRRSCAYQALVFAGFSATWTCLPFLLDGPAYHLGTAASGTFGLVGIATAFCTRPVGRLVDRHGSAQVNRAAFVGVLIAAALLVPAGAGGARGLVCLIAGLLVLDVSMQSGMVANTHRVDSIDPHARGRLRSAFMTCAYLGGSAGSAVGVQVQGRGGWLAVCGLVALLAAVPLAWPARGERSAADRARGTIAARARGWRR